MAEGREIESWVSKVSDRLELYVLCSNVGNGIGCVENHMCALLFRRIHFFSLYIYWFARVVVKSGLRCWSFGFEFGFGFESTLVIVQQQRSVCIVIYFICNCCGLEYRVRSKYEEWCSIFWSTQKC